MRILEVLKSSSFQMSVEHEGSGGLERFLAFVMGSADRPSLVCRASNGYHTASSMSMQEGYLLPYLLGEEEERCICIRDPKRQTYNNNKNKNNNNNINNNKQ